MSRGATRPRLRAVALIGHRYETGRAAFHALRRSEHVDLRRVIVGSERRWERYERALQGPEAGLGRVPPFARYLSAIPFVEARVWLRSLLREIAGRAEDAAEASLPGSLHGSLDGSPVPPLVVDDVNAAEVLARVREDDAEVVFMAAFPQKLSSEWCSIARICTLNFHPSALPRQRGSQPIWWQLFEGELQKGVTIHRVDPEFDTGDILVQHVEPMAGTTSAAELLDWVCAVAPPLVDEAMRALRMETATWTKQDASQATARRFVRKIHRRIQWGQDGNQVLVRRVQAGNYRTPIRPYFFLRDRPIEIEQAIPQRPGPYLTSGLRPEPGTILAWGPDWIDATTIDGVIRLRGLSLHGWPVRCDRIGLAVGERVG